MTKPHISFNYFAHIFIMYLILMVFILPKFVHCQDADLPWSNGILTTDPSGIKFFLYPNPEFLDEAREIVYADINSLQQSGYNRTVPLILLVHGVLSNSLTLQDVQQVKNAYLLENYPANIVMIDYGPLTFARLPLALAPASVIPLLNAGIVTDKVEQRLSDFIVFLIQSGFLVGPQDVHLIGFSIGAHTAGAAARSVFRKTGTKIRRLTGLDPSPQYPTFPKIHPDDAVFVDITLTSLGSMAWEKEEGDAQFFINGGGPHQPNCPLLIGFTETYCSHTTSVFYFAKSIRRKDILGCPCHLGSGECKERPVDCTNPVTYGQHVSSGVHGNYYVSLN